MPRNEEAWSPYKEVIRFTYATYAPYTHQDVIQAICKEPPSITKVIVTNAYSFYNGCKPIGR
jgi:hypothetical protein